MPDIPVAAILKLLDLLLSTVFEFAKSSGLSKEELEKRFTEQLAQFEQNDPRNLPDV